MLLEVKNLKKYFSVGHKKLLRAVDDVTLSIEKGETLGLVGESGCGKSTLGRTVIGLYEPTDGQILFEGKDVTHLKGKERKEFSKNIQMIFQDPYASLNPRMTVSDIIGEGLDIHKIYKGEARQKRIFELLDLVGLSQEHASRFPHEFSGGQRQRIGIARALANEPRFVVCDEPISALDVSIQAQIINTLEELQQKLGLTYLFVSHDLSMVRHISHRMGVMYLGTLVEEATVEDLYSNMLHPYTRALLSAVPVPDPDAARNSVRIHLQGDVPTPIDPPSGCPFRTRCPEALPACAEARPVLKDVGGGHCVACHRV